MCLVARAGSCDAESASTQEDDYAALCWQALIQLMRERATSLDAILSVLRDCESQQRGTVQAPSQRNRPRRGAERTATRRRGLSRPARPHLGSYCPFAARPGAPPGEGTGD